MRRRVLLDEQLPSELKRHLEPHRNYIKLVQEVGWKGVSNGELLRLIEQSKAWDIFIANDQNLLSQQSPKFICSLSYSIIIAAAARNNIKAFLPFVPKIRYLINKAGAGETYTLRLAEGSK